ncbi:hypothetical protein NPIL_409451 [Nephila pilipes]|uniref:Uncharacterized protein n=1 Tax=Nephila pilipes TaxID=299642 RepID=A0A8X6PGV9_NEPPI|nr:hypothetical protein NPIL_409451 [Nephila pilipes]
MATGDVEATAGEGWTPLIKAKLVCDEKEESHWEEKWWKSKAATFKNDAVKKNIAEALTELDPTMRSAPISKVGWNLKNGQPLK